MFVKTMSEHRGESPRNNTLNDLSGDYEIPGYFFDRITRRYFRIPSAGTPLPKIPSSAIQESRKEHIPPRDQSLKNITDLLMKRQLHGVNHALFEKKLLQMKTRTLKMTGTLDFTVTQCRNFKEVVYLKGASYSLLVEFNVHGAVPPVDKSSVTEIYHPYTPVERRQPLFGNFVNKHISVNDICVGFKDDQFLMFVGNSLMSKMGITQIVSRSLARRDIMFRNYTCTYPIWSCCCNNFTEKFAHGLQGAFSLLTVTESMHPVKQRGNVHGITFNKQGNMIYCALHNGRISINDLRASFSVTSYHKIDRIGLDEVILTADENYLICGGFNGLLCKLDLRTHHKVLEYIGHVHTPRKVPFSICEPHNLLCATGCDNVTRLWSLTEGGEPLNYIFPETEGALCRSCLITDGSKVSVFVTEKQKAMLYDIFT